jgi:hypothetical protein
MMVVTGARVMRHRLSRIPQLLQLPRARVIPAHTRVIPTQRCILQLPLVRSLHRVVRKRSAKRNILPHRNVQSRYVTKPRTQRRSQATTRVTLLTDSPI